MSQVSTGGVLRIIMLVSAIQPSPSVTVIVYNPAVNPDWSSTIEPVFHE